MAGIIFDIKYFSIYDGPGIRTCVYFKGCPLRCVWCHNPESQHPEKEIAYSKKKCVRCRKCIRICKNKTLSLTKKGIHRDRNRCILCGKCVAVCPDNAMQMVGKYISSDKVADIIAMDSPFYKDSGGGVTISGGEPSVQVEFLTDTLKKIKQRNIHTAIETCGYFDKRIIPGLIKITDLFLFDIKHINKEKHRQSTGVYPDVILNNFKEIVSESGSEKIIPRIPLIPGFNTCLTSTDEIITFLSETGYSGIVHLLPYNRFSRGKYEKLGKGDQYMDMGILNNSEINGIIRKFTEYGFSVLCNW